jgi:ribosomal protein S27E
MSDELKPVEARCPKCGAQPLNYSHNNYVTPNGAILAAIWCAGCGHVISFTQIGQQKPQVLNPFSISGKPS